MLNNIYISLFISFPETLLILLIGFSLVNIRKISFYKIFTIAIIQAAISLLVMTIDIRAGYSTILQIASIYFLVIIFFQFKYYKAIVPVLIGSFFQGALQSIILPLVSSSLDIDISRLQQDFRSAIISFLPILIISVLMLLIIRKKDYYICKIDD